MKVEYWQKKQDQFGNTVFDEEGEPVLDEIYSVKTGSVLTIITIEKKLYYGE